LIDRKARHASKVSDPMAATWELAIAIDDEIEEDPVV
jgi:hypothetical protein